MGAKSYLSAAQWPSRLAPQVTGRGALSLPNGITVRRFAHTGYELDDMPGCSDHLVAFRLSGVARAERRFGGARWSRTVTRRGSLTIVPALQGSSWRIAGRGEMLYFFFPPALLDRIAAEDLETAGVASVVDRFGAFDPPLTHLAAAFVLEVQNALLGHGMCAEAIATQLAVAVVRRHSAAQGASARGFGRGQGLRDLVRRRVEDHVEAKLGRKITLAELAALSGLSPSRFSHAFKLSLGCPPHQYVLQRRVARAERLLVRTDMPIAEVALASGFANQAHLTATFKRARGTTPKRCRDGAG